MAFDRWRDMWQGNEEPDQTFLFQQFEPVEPQFRPPERVSLPEGNPSGGFGEQPSQAMTGTTDGQAEKIRTIVKQCLEVVQRDPDVALNSKPLTWDMWFSEPLLVETRCCPIEVTLKQRLLGFVAMMLPFLDEKERERLRGLISALRTNQSLGCSEIMTEQDLLHTQWLVQAIRRSRDINNQMEALQRSITKRLPVPAAA